MADQPQVYVNVSGGIAETEVTRGDVEVLHVDWDVFEDNVPEIEEILEIRATLKRVADPEYRRRLLKDLREEISKINHYKRADRLREEAREQQRVEEARELLASRGEI